MIGILGAMSEEVSMLVEQMSDIQIHSHLSRQFYQGSLHGQSVIVVQGGIGKVRSTITATTLVNQFPISHLIFTGVAGALRPGLAMGDVVIAHQAIEHDFGMGRDDGFSPGLDFIPGEEAQVIAADPSLAQLAWDCRDRIRLQSVTAHMPQIYQGLIASGDLFVAGSGVRQRIFASTQADVVEMEGVAVLRVARDAGIPCVLIRSVSDDGDSEAFLQFFTTVAHNSAALVKGILESL